MVRKKGILIIVVCAIALAIALLTLSVYFFSRLDMENYQFGNYQDAQNQGFTKDNWPRQVSHKAIEIHAQSQYDIYDVWMKFEIDQEDARQMVASLSKLSDQEIAELNYRSPSYVDWWFNGFIQKNGNLNGALNADVFVDSNNCETSHTLKNAYIALDRESATAYYGCGS